MDNVNVIRTVAGFAFVLVLFFLVQRRRKNVR